MPHTVSTIWNNFQPSSSIFVGSVLPPLSFLAVSSFVLFLTLTQRKAHTSSLPAHLLTHALAEVSSLIPSQPPHPLLNNQSSNYGTRGKELEETFALSPLSTTIRKKKRRKKQVSPWKAVSCVGVCNSISFHFRFYFKKPH